jgi:hypothetical protein
MPPITGMGSRRTALRGTLAHGISPQPGPRFRMVRPAICRHGSAYEPPQPGPEKGSGEALRDADRPGRRT